MSVATPTFPIEAGSDARKVPVRLLVLQGDVRPAVDVTDEPVAMTFPHLVVRELIALVVLSSLLVLLALLFDAPLEGIANPTRALNPMKAPWYFLGLQELLHYYPPVVAGVILPGVVIVSLIVIPYFNINIERSPFWTSHRLLKFVAVVASVAGLTALFAFSGQHPVWPIIGPLWFVGFWLLLPAIIRSDAGLFGWLSRRSLPFWIFGWFLIVSVVLTTIGVFFRGPGWSFTLPWRDGIY